MEIFNKNKKGFLLAEETLKIIIAVICIIFLIYLLIAVYNSSTSEKKLEQAKDSLSRLEVIISSLVEGGSERQDVPQPVGWHVYSFVGDEKPNSCLNEKCVCICAKSQIELLRSQAAKCDKTGECLIVENLAMDEFDFKINNADNLLFVGIKNVNSKIFLEESR